MRRIERLKHLVEYNCREVIDAVYPPSVEAAGGSAMVVFEVHRHPSDVGLSTGAPGRPWSERHGHTRVAAVLACATPLQEAGTEGVGHG